MKTHPGATRFRKLHVVMKKGIPVFEGKAATGRLPNGTEFSIICPDTESCKEIWQLIMPNSSLDREGLQKVVLCRKSDVEMDVTAAKLNEVNS